METTIRLTRPGGGPFWVLIPSSLLVSVAMLPLVLKPPAPYWLAAGLLCLLAATLAALVLVAVSVRFGAVTATPAGLGVHVPFYSRLFPFPVLKLADAHVVDLTSDWRIALDWRTNAIGLPGYSVGWFRLANGDKAFAAVTDRHRVACIPTTAGYVILVSVADPQALITTLEEASAVQ